MTRFRIRKGGREFTAGRIETLRELAERGLLRPEDPVSVDGGDFHPAVDIAELGPALAAAPEAEDPWRHWKEADEDLDGGDDVLTSFLDQLSPDPAPAVAALPAAPPPAPPRARTITRPAAAAPEPPPLPPPSPPEAPEALDPAHLAPLDAPAPQLRIVEPPPADSAPVSFTDWIETKGADGGQLLENFGRYDDGVIVAARGRPDRINPWRILFLLVIGGSVILGWSLYVSTAASTDFPTEAELEKRVPGAFRGTIKPDNMPVAERKVDALDQELAERSASDRALRDSLRGQIIHFGNREGLEDALFQELFNARLAPASVRVEALELRGGTELADVPVRANVTVRLGAPRDAEYGDEAFQTTLKSAWLLLGKYQAQGRIRFETATVVMAEPLPWDERYEGSKLLSLWNGQLSADDLFLDNR
jgi:hypothetical protein